MKYHATVEDELTEFETFGQEAAAEGIGASCYNNRPYALSIIT